MADLRVIDLADVRPSASNCRLFLDMDELEPLLRLYQAHADGHPVLLPDPPILRPLPEGLWEILAGERRITAALMSGVLLLVCRIEVLSDDAAYHFLLAHNRTVGMTTAEMAFRAGEMHHLGYSFAEIEETMPDVRVSRYVAVGHMMDRDWFTDDAKLCDPSITEWYEAAHYGKRHFRRCFAHWVSGLWDAETCRKNFRKRGDVLPLDTAERGFRVSRNANRLLIRGTLDLDLVSLDEARLMITTLQQALGAARNTMLEHGMFGLRHVDLINPTTITAERRSGR